MSKVIGSIRSPVTFSATDLPRLLHYTHTRAYIYIYIYDLRLSFLSITVHSIYSRSSRKMADSMARLAKKGPRTRPDRDSGKRAKSVRARLSKLARSVLRE